MPTQNRSENLTMVLSLEGLKRVLQDFSNWGNSEIVVNVAATSPTAVTASIVAQFCAPALFTFLFKQAFFAVRMSNMWVLH